MRKSMLKQEFLKFRIGEAEGLHKALTLKTKGGLELLSFDELYYKLKTLEVDVKGYNTFSSSQSIRPSHFAFVSATSTSKKISYGDSLNYSSTTTYSVPSNSKTGSHRYGNAIEEGAAKIYNLITRADTEEATIVGDVGEFAIIGVTSEDDSTFSVFTTTFEDVEGRPIFHRFAKTDSMKAVPPPLTGDYTSLSNHTDLDESQMSYGVKSSTSCDPKYVPNNFVSYDDIDNSLEVNTNNIASSDSSLKSSEHKPTDSTSYASTSSVSISVNEAETSCNKNGSFNKKAGHFRKYASSVSKLCFVCGIGTHLIKDCDFYEKQVTNRTVGIGVGPVVRPQLISTSKPKFKPVPLGKPKVTQVSIGKPKVKPVPTGKPHVSTLAPTGRPNRPFPVPTNRGYSPSTPQSANLVPPSCIPVPTGKVPVPTGSLPVPTGSIPVLAATGMVPTDDVLVHTSSSTDLIFDGEPTTRFPCSSNFGNHNPSPGIFSSSLYDDEFDTALNNVASFVEVSPMATKRIITIHPQSLIIGDPTSAMQTRSKVKQNTTVDSAFISYNFD
uniref:Ribonuclease H-like domain, reverse transcriptase, RNA-dependent DNA polymerase n=1 Tax=Tanacetum cinerariifolium TaxID=118510 RepID=A0A6L2KUH4_TANCI|nr:ribonuclease H-like domain, reverse transcriptase, RNA-dependent DNA polymerase [Tanacetum cinerariifolium]